MKLIKKVIFVVCLFMITPLVINAQEEVDIYLFWGDSCPHCAHEKEFLNELEKENKNLNVHLYEVWNDKDNAELMEQVKTSFGIEATSSVPFTVIGNQVFSGYSDSIGSQIESALDKCYENGCEDVVVQIMNDNDIKIENSSSLDDEVDIPLLGNVNVKDASLPLIALVIGLVDGFNPCAMWILLFLISMLLGMKNKKRMWALGITFLAASSIVYLLFMVAWLGITLKISQVLIVRIIIAVIALIGGIVNLRSYFKANDSGCEVVDDRKRKKIIDKIKKIIHEKSFILAILGVIALAFTVNLIELACSAGLPLLFTQILALNDLSNVQYIVYILIYIFFFLLDDLIVFIVAMVTLQVTGITTKYNKVSHLIGGVLMILIGLLLIFKPEWIMFNF